MVAVDPKIAYHLGVAQGLDRHFTISNDRVAFEILVGAAGLHAQALSRMDFSIFVKQRALIMTAVIATEDTRGRLNGGLSSAVAKHAITKLSPKLFQ